MGSNPIIRPDKGHILLYTSGYEIVPTASNSFSSARDYLHSDFSWPDPVFTERAFWSWLIYIVPSADDGIKFRFAAFCTIH